MRLTDHQRALWTCLIALPGLLRCGSEWWPAVLTVDSVVISLDDLCKNTQSSGGLLCSCYALLPSVELSDSESVSESLLESGRKGKESRAGDLSWWTVHVNAGAFQFISTQVNTALTKLGILAFQFCQSLCMGVHFSSLFYLQYLLQLFPVAQPSFLIDGVGP